MSRSSEKERRPCTIISSDLGSADWSCAKRTLWTCLRDAPLVQQRHDEMRPLMQHMTRRAPLGKSGIKHSRHKTRPPSRSGRQSSPSASRQLLPLLLIPDSDDDGVGEQRGRHRNPEAPATNPPPLVLTRTALKAKENCAVTSPRANHTSAECQGGGRTG